MQIKIKKINNNAIIPTKGSEYAAGYDLSANTEKPITIKPHETIKIGTGLLIEVPTGYFGGIFARSGIATKHGLRPANCVGVCDSDYTGEYMVAIHNDSDTPYTVQPNEKIAQLIIIKHLECEFVEVDKLTETKRSVNGFGSTGK